MNEESIFLIYEPEQADDAVAYVREHPDTAVVALDFWAERALKEKGIPCRSLTDYCPPWEDQIVLLEKAETIAREWYRLSEISFFEYRGIRIGEALEIDFDNYVQHVLYRLHVIKCILNAHPQAKRVIVPYSKKQVPPTSPPLTPFELNSVVDVTMFLGRRNGIEISVLGNPMSSDVIRSFPPQSPWRILPMRIYNALMGLLPRKPLKLFASEYWFHIAPFIEKMDDVELVLMDRSEIREISWRQLLKHRVRFLHPLDEVTTTIRAKATSWEANVRRQWKNAKSAVGAMPEFMHEGASFWPLVEQGFDFIVGTHAERVVSDIDSIEKILRDEHIDKVLLRASVSAQHHFFVIAKLCHRLEIPDIEIQHASAVFDANSARSRLESSYLAAYGKLTKSIYIRNHGYTPERIREIGSARFDRYLQARALNAEQRAEGLRALGLDPSHPVMLVAVPAEGSALWLSPMHASSYEIADFFQTLRQLKVSIPDLQLLFKFRSRSCGTREQAYLSEIFPDGGIAMTDADLFSMLVFCDVASSGNSTVLQEIIIAGKPLILFPWNPADSYNLNLYKQFAPVAFSSHELIEAVNKFFFDPTYKENLLCLQKDFLGRDFMFDGNASERTAVLLRENLHVFSEES